MYFCIDFDSRQVESKSESREDLDKYVTDNDLELAVAIVENSDELCLQFSINELSVLAGNVGVSNTSGNEDELADRIWHALMEGAEDYPTFNSKVGKKLLSRSETKEKAEPKPKAAKPKSAPKQSSGGSRAKLDLEAPLFVVDGKCKSGSILATIVAAIEDELCATIGEVRNYILENHVIPKTGELADEKFADHNIKYFLKQGKISTEEEL